MKILKNFDNKLCDRAEYTIEINHPNNKTPSLNEVRKKVAEELNNKENLISIKGIYTKYGFGKSIANAYSYSNENSFKRFEIINKKKKNGKENKGKEETKK